jgi:hypothetical protein
LLVENTIFTEQSCANSPENEKRTTRKVKMVFIMADLSDILICFLKVMKYSFGTHKDRMFL